ncbi:MAG: zinc ribbon domain-containing protein [Chloroflexi bacterium]|nr:zinc ribbon domain-containing protein [Chloroflexota bacterium]MBE3120268.1 zinc ribbon domain-containing protein [Candidatus Atribacteria bacterium]
MKKGWKWIIGIVLGLVILAVLMSVGFMVRRNFHVYRAEALDSRGFSERGPGMMPYGGFGSHMRGPGMMGYGLMPFGGFFGGLFSLGFLALVVLGIIWLVRSLRTPKPVEGSAAMAAAVVNPCKKCGRPIQDDWKICPYCGKKM